MERTGYRRWWGLSALLACLLLAFLGYAFFHTVVRDAFADPAELDELYKAAGAVAALDIRDGKKPIGFPVEAGAASSHAYFDLLAAHGYVTARDRRRLDDFVIANVSVSDPAETAFLVSRSYYDAWRDHRPLPAHYLVLLKYGQACTAAGNGVPLRLPKRAPEFLEP